MFFNKKLVLRNTCEITDTFYDPDGARSKNPGYFPNFSHRLNESSNLSIE